jgi:molybdenum cofactor cytidylyltransferase
MTVGVLLLAAGSSQRFGSDKRIAQLPDGRTLLNAAIECVLDSGLPLRVCLGAEDSALAATLERRGIDVAVCQTSPLGMGATLAEAARGLGDWSAVLVALADMPLIQPATIARIAAAATSEQIVVPSFRGQQGHPVAFGNHFFDLLTQCKGDRGARWVIEHNPQAVHELAIDDAGILRDVDTPDALRGL